MLCGKLHCQKYFELKDISCKIPSQAEVGGAVRRAQRSILETEMEPEGHWHLEFGARFFYYTGKIQAGATTVD